MRNKKYFNKLTTMHINDELHDKVLELAKKEDLYFYQYVDKVLKEKLSEE